MKAPMKTPIRFAAGAALLAAVGSLGGCLSMQNQPAIQALQGNMGAGGAKPFVEAYVEYRGPSEKWAGPTSFLLHVVAKDAGVAKISITPALFATPQKTKDADGTTVQRTLAAKGMAGETARTHMSNLANAIQGGEQPFRGCLSPVRVRLVRADGAIVEKQGCRGSVGWPKAASEAVNQFILTTLQGS